jgi:hypothetical protein
LVIQPTGNNDGRIVLAPSGTNTISYIALQSNPAVDTVGSNFFAFGGGFAGAPANAWSFGSVVYAQTNSNSLPIAFVVSNTTSGRIEAMRITSAGLVGIGTTTPGAKLEVETGASATKGLIVQGAASQSANLTEWQNSAGTVLAYVTSAGAIHAQSIRSGTLAARIEWDATDWLRLVGGSGTLLDHAIAFGPGYASRINPSANGSILLVAGSTATVPSIIRGAASQTANLTEWQNSAAAVLTRMGANGVYYPLQAPTASAPTYVLGGMYFDTTLNKLRIGGASGWETVTSV